MIGATPGWGKPPAWLPIYDQASIRQRNGALAGSGGYGHVPQRSNSISHQVIANVRQFGNLVQTASSLPVCFTEKGTSTFSKGRYCCRGAVVASSRSRIWSKVAASISPRAYLWRSMSKAEG